MRVSIATDRWLREWEVAVRDGERAELEALLIEEARLDAAARAAYADLQAVEKVVAALDAASRRVA